MRKEDIVNKCESVIYDGYNIYFIIQTIGDNDFWWWNVNKTSIRDYFSKNPVAIYELAQEKLSKNHCEIFINDVENDMLGVSCGSFETIEEAIKDIVR